MVNHSPARALLALRTTAPTLLAAPLSRLLMLPLAAPLLLLGRCSTLLCLAAPPGVAAVAAAPFDASCAAFLSIAFWQGMTPTRGVPLAGAGDMLSARVCCCNCWCC